MIHFLPNKLTLASRIRRILFQQTFNDRLIDSGVSPLVRTPPSLATIVDITRTTFDTRYVDEESTVQNHQTVAQEAEFQHLCIFIVIIMETFRSND